MSNYSAIQCKQISNQINQENRCETQVKLPIIKLPCFGGSYTGWLELRDSFIALVHENKEISDIQKYYYLKSSLEGDASQIIESITVSAVNYTIAWDMLRERFENKRLIIHHHMKAIFEQSSIVKESHTKLRHLFDNVNKNLRSIKSLGLNTDEWDTIIIYILSSKFDSITRRDWESFEIAHDLPSMADMNKFLKNKCEILEQLEVNRFENTTQGKNNTITRSKNRIPSNTNTYVSTNRSMSCLFCKSDHLIYKCESFSRLSVNDRIAKVKNLGACLNCLRKNHLVRDCVSIGCFKCGRKHHTLLHLNTENNVDNTRSDQNTNLRSIQHRNESASTSNSNVHHALDNTDLSQVVLSTALLQIIDKKGKAHTCRALLDNGSQRSIINMDLCKKLGLNKTKTQSKISGINKSVSNVQYQTSIKITSLDGLFSSTIHALILPKITEELPSVSFDYTCLKIPENIQLADPTFDIRGNIDILLGSNIYWDLLRDEKIQLGKNKPKLQLTHLGWIVGGNMNCYESQSNYSTFLTIETLNNNVEKFWEIENCSNKRQLLSDSERYCEDQFEKHFERNEHGRYVVTIPSRENISQLGESRKTALDRFHSLENKLKRNINLQGHYRAFMNEYAKLGHMSRIEEQHSSEAVNCYLPHHAVVKETSLTTKVRVVFDASAKTDSGLSFNDTQFVGPTVQNDLIAILMYFRWNTYVLSGDITMMYRQVLIRPDQRRLQRIFWRNSPVDNIECYELNTVTYGTASAPYLATRCLEQIAIENDITNPQISRIIRKHMYMDDILTGTESIQDLLGIQQSLLHIFKSAGFELRKWQTNVPSLVNEFEIINKDSTTNIINLSDNQTSKTLGIYWDPNSDLIKYSVSEHNSKAIITKRLILSEVSQVFDPLGCLSPVIIVAKLLIQKLWQLQISWDELVPRNIEIRWLDFRNQLKQITNISIPRQITEAEAIFHEIHGFADASERAYGACVYIRTKLKSNNFKTRLMCAKSRVAPIKNVSLPRLELCAAQLLANLTQKVIESLEIEIENIFYWSDSTITLFWIKGPPNKWETFIANRVGDILTSTRFEQWHHVKSEDNPADLISRGVTVDYITDSAFWFMGPTWLAEEQSKWPKSSFSYNSNIEIPEERKIIVNIAVHDNHELYSRYSDFIKLLRVTAYIFRFFNNCKLNKKNRIFGPLNTLELKKSDEVLIKQAQYQHFNLDIKYFKQHAKLHKKSKLLPLNAFLDENRIMRVGGRMIQSNYDFQKMHPIILPPNHNLTNLILRYEHCRLGHCGAQQLLASVRERYWPLKGRHLCKQITQRCVTCFKTRPRVLEQLMGNLPNSRITQSPPFYNTGIDYAGPILIRDKKSRGFKLIKSYICLFVCLATKAIHIELVSDMTSEAFIATLRRFTSRRGNPRNIYSDNGSNFVGANKDLQTFYKFLENEERNIINKLSLEYITWHFIPPRAPNFGGLWEASIKQVKNHLKRIVGNATLTFEELITLLAQIEAILNSRPLTPMSENPEDLDVLTPAHFLVGQRLTSVPDPDLQDIADNRLSRFQYIQKLQQQFWKRWSTEYLAELQHRYKWQIAQNIIKLHTMVLIKDENLPPLRWTMGRIIGLHPGPDNLIRVVTIKTPVGDVKRSVSKICILPFEGNNSE